MLVRDVRAWKGELRLHSVGLTLGARLWLLNFERVMAERECEREQVVRPVYWACVRVVRCCIACTAVLNSNFADWLVTCFDVPVRALWFLAQQVLGEVGFLLLHQ